MPSFFIGAAAALFNHSCQIIPAKSFLPVKKYSHSY